MTEPLQTLVLIDPWAGGHHTSSMCNFAHAVLALGFRVLALCPEPDVVQRRVRELAPARVANLIAEPFEWESYASPYWRIRDTYVPLKQFAHVTRAIREARRKHPDLRRPRAVVLCWIDDYLLQASPLVSFLLPMVLPYRMTGIYFHPRFLRIANGDYEGMRRSALLTLRTPNLRSVALLDDGVVSALHGACGKPVIRFPEYMDTRLPPQRPTVVDRMRAQAAGRSLVGVVGSLERRKGVMRILDMAASAECPDVLFSLIGALGEDERATYSASEWDRLQSVLSAPPLNVFVHAGRLADERDFNAVIQAFDALYVAYDNFPHSSGILTKAAAFGKTVVVSKGYCLEERVGRFRLGLAIDPANLSCAKAAIAVVTDRERFEREVGVPDFQGYLQAHSWDEMLKAFQSMLRPCGVDERNV
jgi:glycosyltransferase involved in cell wall biosynthesis